MKKVRFDEGARIFAEGDESLLCYKIISGKVEISLNMTGPDGQVSAEIVAECGAGEIIGEMSVIDKGTRTASAVAIEPTVCMSYDAAEIIGLLTDDPSEALAYVRTMIRRVRETNRRADWGSRQF